MNSSLIEHSSHEPELIRLAYAMVVEPASHHILADAIDEVMLNFYDGIEPIEPENLFKNVEIHFNNALSLLEKQGRKTDAASSSIKNIEIDPRPVALITHNASILMCNQAGTDEHGWSAGYVFSVSDFVADGHDLLVENLKNIDGLEDDKTICVIHIKNPNHTNSRPYVLSKVTGSGGLSMARLTSINLRWSADIAAQFQSSFQLTPIELRITQAIVASQSLRDLASERGRSLGTLRNQLKHLLAKLELSSQTELVCLYSGYVQLTMSSDTSTLEHNFRQTPWRRQSTFVRNEFVLDYSEVGPKTGRPILFFHPVLLGNSVCETIRQEINNRHIRLIMPWRPGFGMTSLTSNSKESPKDFAAHCIALLNHLGINKVQLLAENTGTISAMYFAANAPERTSALTAMSPILPLKRAYFKSMSKQQRSLYYIAQHAPKLMPLIIRSIVAKCDTGFDEEWVLNHFKDFPLDLKTMARPDIKALARETYAISYMNGIQGSVRDFNATGQQWQAVFDAFKGDVSFIVGQHTGQFNPETLRNFACEKQNIHVHAIEGAACFVMHQKPKLVFDLIDLQHTNSITQAN